MMTKWLLLLTTLALLARPADATEEWKLDLGPSDSPVAAGWTPLTPDDAYTPQRGCGWIRRPESAFSRDRYWNGELPLWHAPLRELPLDPLTRDGVASQQPMELRLDVPEGNYVVRVWFGDYIEAAKNQCVDANGRPVGERVTAGIGGLWGQILRAVTVPVRGVASADHGQLRLVFRTTQAKHAARVVAAQVRRYAPGWVRLEGTQLRWSGPASPDAEEVCRLLNAGDAAKARQRIAGIAANSRRFERACLLEALSGSLAIIDPRECETIVKEACDLLASEIPGVAPHAVAERRQLLSDWRTALGYYRMMRYAAAYRETKKDSYRRYEESASLAGTILPDEPAYWQAQLLRARLHCWRGMEGDPVSTQRAKPIIETLFKNFPDHRIVRLYANQPAPSLRPRLPSPPAGAPDWAVRERELLVSVLDVARFWITQRQTPEGELGGGWNDDVEVLRRWGAVALAVDVPWLNEAIAKMADGAWNENPDLQKFGYPADIGDVEHNAEDVSDTQPLALALNYGQPRFVERCLHAVRSFGTHWTAISPSGHRRFKSYNYGAERIDPNPNAAYDVPLNARAAKPGLWAVWYNGEPGVLRLFREWGLGWVEACARAAGGKPAGVIPAGVRVSDDSFPPKWYATPGYSAIGSARYSELLYEHLLAMWSFTGDAQFLAPLHSTMQFVLQQRGAEGGAAGSAPWTARQLWPQVREVASKWRLISGDTRYDEALRADAMPYVRQLLGEKDELLLGNLKQAAQGNSERFEMLTSEVLFTDRIFIRGHEHLYAMYGGGVGDTSGCPGWAVRWEKAGEDLAAWVVEATTARFRARVYSFADAEREFAMQHWRLAPGRYKLTLRADAAEASPLWTREVELPHRGDSVPLRLPAERALVVEMTQLAKRPWDPAALADLAAAPAPSSAVGEPVAWEVFNLGCVTAKGATVRLSCDGRLVESRTLTEVPAARDYALGRAVVRFPYRPAAGAKLTLALDPDDRIPEITERNNSVEALVAKKTICRRPAIESATGEP